MVHYILVQQSQPPRKRRQVILVISSNIDRVSEFFHRHTGREIRDEA